MHVMITRKLLASLAFSFLFMASAVAQGKLAEEADDAFKKGFYFNAIELYKKAYTVEKKASTKAELIFKVGESYRALGDAQQAAGGALDLHQLVTQTGHGLSDNLL